MSFKAFTKFLTSHKSLRSKLILALLLYVMVIIVFVELIVGYLINDAMKEDLQKTLSVSTYLAKNIDNRIEHLMENAKSFANNHFVINSLIDIQGRDVYLPGLINEYTKSKDVKAATIVDFSEKIIFSNSDELDNYKQALYLRPVLEIGKMGISFSSDHKVLFIAVPILYYNTPQGALISNLDFSQILSNVMIENNNLNLKVFARDELLLVKNESLKISKNNQNKNFKTQFSYIDQLGISLKLDSSKDVFLSPISRAVLKLILITFFLLIVSIIIAIKMGDKLANPVLKLCSRVAEAHNSPEIRCSPTGTNDELEELARLFDNRTDQLIKRAEEVEESHQKLVKTQSQLIQSAKLASLGTLSAGVAHELNNPLTSVMGHSILIKEIKDNPEKIIDKANKIYRAATRMKSIIDHLRTFTRESKNEDFKQFPISQPIDNALEFLRNQLKLRDIEIKTIFPGSSGNVLGDSNQLESIFQNLLVNSRDAFEEIQDNRKKKITSLAFVEKGKIEIIYKDNAMGMTEVTQNNIFDPFFTTKEAGKGTGLGMSICKNILDQHKGTISVDSIYGKGTKFKLTLPSAES